MPQSATFTRPDGVTRMLPGLMSRWSTPAVCAAPRAAAMSVAMSTAVAGGSGPSAADQVGEAAALDVLHHDEVGAVLLAPVVDADDVGVVEVGGGLGLAPEPGHEVGVVGVLGEQDLDRDRPVELQVAGEEHLGHAALAEAAVQLVAAVEDGGLRHGGSSR